MFHAFFGNMDGVFQQLFRLVAVPIHQPFGRLHLNERSSERVADLVMDALRQTVPFFQLQRIFRLLDVLMIFADPSCQPMQIVVSRCKSLRI